MNRTVSVCLDCLTGRRAGLIGLNHYKPGDGLSVVQIAGIGADRVFEARYL